jgi:ribosomal protein uS19
VHEQQARSRTCSAGVGSFALHVDIAQLCSSHLLHTLLHGRFQRGLKRKPLALIKKLRKAKKDAGQGEKPEAVRTHLRNMIIVPEMIGSVIGVYNGKTFNQVRCIDVMAYLALMLWLDAT